MSVSLEAELELVRQKAYEREKMYTLEMNRLKTELGQALMKIADLEKERNDLAFNLGQEIAVAQMYLHELEMRRRGGR